MSTCFVIQGFGPKTDLATGRKLDLDASYAVIKEAVEQAGLTCVRADEIHHAGTIDRPMYEWLMRADVVIADLSTSNVNAVFELGVRYGLRPRTTIIVAESEFQNPFDLSHINIVERYVHLGPDLGAREARRFRDALAGKIKDIVAAAANDSPVYEFLPLTAPSEAAAAVAAAAAPATKAPATDDQNTKQLAEQAWEAMRAGDFTTAKVVWGLVRKMRPNDDMVVQQLALATYKSKQPSVREALIEARNILNTLRPESTNDPETLGLWGAVHKRLWEVDSDPAALDASIAAYERGFYLKQDYYTGINFAYLLNVRADLARRNGQPHDAIADFVLARRVRKDVVEYANRALAQPDLKPDERFWITATLWEAAVGLEDAELADRWKQALDALPAAGWMRESATAQVGSVQTLLASSPLRT